MLPAGRPLRCSRLARSVCWAVSPGCVGRPGLRPAGMAVTKALFGVFGSPGPPGVDEGGDDQDDQADLHRPDAFVAGGQRIVDGVGRVVAVRGEDPTQESPDPACVSVLTLMTMTVIVVSGVLVSGVLGLLVGHRVCSFASAPGRCWVPALRVSALRWATWSLW